MAKERRSPKVSRINSLLRLAHLLARDIATNMQIESGKHFSVGEVRETLIHFLCADRIGERYEQYLGWLGEKAELTVGEERFSVTLQSVDDEGNLWVEMQGEHRRFAAAEVSIHVQKK